MGFLLPVTVNIIPVPEQGSFTHGGPAADCENTLWMRMRPQRNISEIHRVKLIVKHDSHLGGKFSFEYAWTFPRRVLNSGCLWKTGHILFTLYAWIASTYPEKTRLV